jgi:RNA polymerase sigma factor (sigma-70 family)
MPADAVALSDTALVVRAQAGDRAAFATLYDQYSARIYDLCAHMLRDPDAAADATAEVFLAAAEHLDQLTDPMKVKSWLYAIARNEVYRRGRARSREAPIAAMDEVALPSVTAVDDMLDAPRAEPAGTAALLREASLGLADRDRLVLELTLAGGLDGHALGDALGVSVDAAHQAAHRMRERLARSVGALLVARQGAAECGALQGVLTEWDGTYSPLWRKRVARHVDRCAVCGRRGRSIREKVLTGAFAALPLGFLTPPQWLRRKVLDDAVMPPDVSGQPRGGRWRRSDGFPPLEKLARRRHIAAIVLGGAMVALLVIGGVSVLEADDRDTAIVAEKRTTTSVGGNTAREAPTTVPGQPGVLGPGDEATTTTKPKAVPPPPPADTAGPTLNVSSPEAFAVMPCGGANVYADAADPSGVVSVTVQYSGPAVGSFALSPSGGSSWSRLDVKFSNVGVYTFTFTARDAVGNANSASVPADAQICVT